MLVIRDGLSHLADSTRGNWISEPQAIYILCHGAEYVKTYSSCNFVQSCRSVILTAAESPLFGAVST